MKTKTINTNNNDVGLSRQPFRTTIMAYLGTLEHIFGSCPQHFHVLSLSNAFLTRAAVGGRLLDAFRSVQRTFGCWVVYKQVYIDKQRCMYVNPQGVPVKSHFNRHFNLDVCNKASNST